MTIPASTPNNPMSSPESEAEYNGRAEEHWQGGGQGMDIDYEYPGSAPEYTHPIPIQTGYVEHSHSLPFSPPLLSSGSPIYAPTGFSAINQNHGYASSAQTIVSHFPNTGAVDIPQSSYQNIPFLNAVSPPNATTNVDIFAPTEGAFLGDLGTQVPNWEAILQSNHTQPYQWTQQTPSVEHYGDLYHSYPSGNEIEQRRDSISYDSVYPYA
jgi:hypothetical protein